MPFIDLNCDLGESFGAYALGRDAELLPYITSANIACGFHAGDPAVMDATVKLAKERGVAIGAHPGFPDLVGFGRRDMAVSPADVKSLVKYQIGALLGFCRSHGAPLVHVKAHGALYNMAGRDYRLARAVAEAAFEVDEKLILLALSGSEMLRAAADIGLRAASEAFADRAYRADGSLVPRTEEGALIRDADACVRRVVRMVRERKVAAVTGEDIELNPQSICVHGDTPEALEFAGAIGARLKAADVKLVGLKRVLAGI